MPLLINNKTIPDINTTILYTSEYNYTLDTIEYINKNFSVIDKTNRYQITDINEDILKLFNCEYLKTKTNLTLIDTIKINILSNLEASNIIIFLNVLTYLDLSFKKELITYLKDHHIRIINYTTDIEESLLLEYIIVIHDNKVIMEGKKEDILSEEKILKKLGFNLPFIVDLSLGLKYYNLVNEIYFDNESLVQKLWN